ncbi:CDP-diacylglycerol--glycerol-3-phosphate 3-phosphatidyltransferase [Pseudolysinimonas sp.]|uniref:CDP-diacylglycerol--glycerol-3-phosphate 3-phosphatidyltransferase n=1 Tax=Pseudolysinimonas sp. TaxID=2680009 RepID=UPI00286C6B28|nr:CDP-diacylglycerol--glycerol-3-phosphate 3-phosphatidyltransferase [Pseudolysinimonas sp.]
MRGRVVRGGEGTASAGNLANIITVFRMLLAPVFVVLLLLDAGDDGYLRYIAAGLFIFASATDGVDGFLARRRNLVTDAGKLLDPIADKLLTGGALVSLSILGELPWWVTGVILLREVGITVLRFVALRDHVIAASILGKVKTWVQIIAISFAIVPLWTLFGDGMHVVNAVLMTLAVIITLVSGAEYLWQARKGRPVKPSPTSPVE